MLVRSASLSVFAMLVVPATTLAFRPPVPGPLAERAFSHPGLRIPAGYVRGDLLPAPAREARVPEIAALGVTPRTAYLDLRGGRWGTLMPHEPLIPGDGSGNGLRWEPGTAPASAPEVGQAAWRALVAYVTRHAASLHVDPAQLAPGPGIAVHEGGGLVQIVAGRVVGGIPVRGATLTAVVNHGNLVLLGTRNWGTLPAMAAPVLSEGDARAVVAARLSPHPVMAFRKPHLLVVPLAAGTDPARVTPGEGYEHRLAWEMEPVVAGELGSWEALVDAHTGELLALADANHYATRSVKGGVFPVSNDGVAPDGVEQPGLPMPYADAGGGYANGAGVVGCGAGSLSTTLDGRFVRMSDACGDVLESSTGDVDLGASAGTDCTTPAGHSAGDTHSSRTGFYEINRLVEMAKGYLPDNAWMKAQLTANMNIEDTCNAFWNGSTINFYRSGGGCANTGEIAAVFDHEWGHGLDDNDASREVSAPGESTADIFAMLRLHTSCIGRGFDPASNCGGYGDACSACTGVRDIDWARHASGQPHDVAWIFSPTILAGGGCLGVAGTQQGPCGLETHCEGMVPAEAAYDLAARDLQAAPSGLDEQSAFEVAARLAFLGAGGVVDWYNCNPVSQTGDGCNADGGYLNILAADDTNGDLADGTPHMQAIHAAFARHGIACATPAVQDAGCAGAPTAAPAVTATPLDQGVRLSWSPVPDATRYVVYRTEGVFGCDFGKVRVAETTATSFADEGLGNGIAYAYTVAAAGASDACSGPMSACVPATPVAGPNLHVPPSATFTTSGGDGDPFVDSCEYGQVAFTAQNAGSGALTNVRIVGVTSPSHPGVTFGTPLPKLVAASLAECASAPASVAFRASGMTPGAPFEVRVELTSDELALLGVTRLQTMRTVATEADLTAPGTRTFTFEAGMEGWSAAQGAFGRSSSGGGAAGTAFYLASSSLGDDACDQVRSPIVRLAADSTLSLWNQYAIEPMSDAWYDRANVALQDVESGVRTTVVPSGGRLYAASGANGACVTTGEPGWAGLGPLWTQSSWSAAALGAGPLAGRLVKLDVGYGTDATVSGAGVSIDEVTLTNVQVQTADGQGDVCLSGAPGEPRLLMVGKSPGKVDLSWSAPTGGCNRSDYAVHAGSLASLASGNYDHAVQSCTTANLPAAQLDLPAGSVYFIVTSLNAVAEGSYGKATSGVPRPPSANACRSFLDPATCP